MLGCQDEDYLVVNQPIRDTPGCYHRQLVGMESVGKGESVVTRSVHLLSLVPPTPNLPSVPAQCCYGIPTALNYKYILFQSLCYDAIKLLIELFNLIFIV